jgi:hypothetical protein
MYGEWCVCQLCESVGCMKENLTESKHIFASGNTSYWWVKDFVYIYCNVITNSSSLYCNGTYMREDNR